MHQVDRQGVHARRQAFGEGAKQHIALLAKKLVIALHGARVAFHGQLEPLLCFASFTVAGCRHRSVQRRVAVDQAGAVIEFDQSGDFVLGEQLGVDQEHFQARVDGDEVSSSGKAAKGLAHVCAVGFAPARLVVHQAGQGDQRADVPAAIGKGLLEQVDGLRGIRRAAAGQHFAEQARGAQVATCGQMAQVCFDLRLAVLKQRITDLLEAARRMRRAGESQRQGGCAKKVSDRHGDLRTSSAGAGRV